MKNICLAVMLLATLSLFGQGKTLYDVAFMIPKAGQVQAFESAWKAHLVKFHNKSESRRSVFEIVSGDNTGMYQLVDGPFELADMDKEKPNVKAHDLDFFSTVSSKLDVDKEGYIYRWVDTLSYNYKDVVAPKFQQTIYTVKPGMMADFMKEFRRSIIINEQIKSSTSYTVYVLMFSGSKPQLVLRRALKEGFKELDTDFTPSRIEEFKAAYIKQFGQGEWDAFRATPTAIYKFVDAIDICLIKERKDLSTVEKPTASK